MNIEFLTSSCHCCIDECKMTVNMSGFCSLESIEQYMKDGKLTMIYRDFLNLDDKSIEYVLQAAETDTELHYHLALLLYLLEFEEGRIARNNLYNKLVDVGIDPYYKIQQVHLHKLIDSGNLAAFLYTVSNITMNNNIDIDLTRLQIEFLLACMMVIKDVETRDWKKALSKLIMVTLNSKITITTTDGSKTVAIKDTQIFESIHRAFLSSICKEPEVKQTYCPAPVVYGIANVCSMNKRFS